MHTEALEEYRDQVSRVFSGEADEAVFNGTIDHARILTEGAFRGARSTVRILIRKLESPQLDCDSVISAVRAFLCDRNTTLELLVEDATLTTGGGFCRAAKAAGDDRVTLRVVPQNVQARYKFNFLTVDDFAYRFQDDRERPIAAAAGGPRYKATTAHLNKLFEQLWGQSQEAPIPA